MGVELPTVALAVLQIAVSVALTEMTYRWIETPIRYTQRRPARILAVWTTAALATIGVAATTLTNDLTALPQGNVLRPSSIPAPPTSLQTSPTSTFPSPAVDFADNAPTANDVGVDLTPTVPLAPVQRLMLVGDSTAYVLGSTRPGDLPAGWEVTEYARLGCSITDGAPVDVNADEPFLYATSECAEWFNDWSDLSRKFQPTISVVMIGAWEVFDHVVNGQRKSYPGKEWTSHIDTAIRRGVEAASAGGGRVIFLRLPCMDQSAAALLEAQARSDQRRIATFNAVLESVADDLETVSTLPLDDLLCPDGEPLGSVDGATTRYDGVHLTEDGTKLVWTWLEAQLEALLQSAV